MKIIDVDIEKIKPYKDNPRLNDGAVDAAISSIKEFGFLVPVVIDSNNVIVAGHTRIKALKKMGIKNVPCVIASDLTENQVKAFRLADNRVGEIAQWDTEKLMLEIEELGDFDLERFGFDETLCDVEFEPFDGGGDGGGSYISSGDKVRVVIGACMFDIEDSDHAIYNATKELDEEQAEAGILQLFREWGSI